MKKKFHFPFIGYHIVIIKTTLKESDGWKRYSWTIEFEGEIINWGYAWTLKGAKQAAKSYALNREYDRRMHYE